MIGLIIATSLLAFVLLNTWCTIFMMVRQGGMWLDRGDLKFLILCAFLNPFIILAVDKICKVILEKKHQRMRNKKF
jgi:hypothetical protein